MFDPARADASPMPDRMIPSADLVAADLPSPGAPWRHLSYLALTLPGDEQNDPGDAAHAALDRIAAAHASGGVPAAELPRDVRTLRLLLFCLQRQWRWSGDRMPPDRDVELARAIVDAIRSVLQAH